MDRSTEWPWNWEVETEWKAELEERDHDLIEELIDSAFEDKTTVSNVLGPPQEQKPAEDGSPEKYLITA